jgi:phospholipase C
MTGMAAATGAMALGGCNSDGDSGFFNSAEQIKLPAPADSGIDHIVVLMMENRSFDHYLGWVPGANGRQAGVSYRDKDGNLQSTFRLSQDAAYGYQGCGKEDPDHSYEGGRTQYNGGAMNGWLQTVGGADDLFPIGYYTADDLPFFKGVVDNWTICDHYFTGILSSTFPNRIYMHAGETDRNTNSFDISSLPTIWDRCAAKGVSANYYFNDLPLTALWAAKYLPISRTLLQFQIDAIAGLLPSVSFVDPFFGASIGEGLGISADDHPQADIRNGQAFLNQVYNILRTSPQWNRTLLIINYDEWGGFYDHVIPPVKAVSQREKDAIGNDGRLGFRVPCALIGPRARRGYVHSTPFDPSSIHKLIEWRFGLEPLGIRGPDATNMAVALDFDHEPRTDTPAFNVPNGPFGVECTTGLPVILTGTDPLGGLTTLTGGASTAPSTAAPQRSESMDAHAEDWRKLQEMARQYGFPV